MVEKNEEVEVEETLDLPEVQEGEEDTTDWKSEAQKLREKAIAQRERTKAKNERIKALEKEVELSKTTAKTPDAPKTGDLDDNALDYLDLKGISEDEDIKVIQDIVKKTGLTVRQALKDDYVTSKLEANKQARETKAAMPNSSKRAGSQSDGFDTALAKAEQSGGTELPKDFELRKRVVNALSAKQKGNRPAWHD